MDKANLNVNINPSDLEDVLCDKCGSQCFEPTFLFKKLSAVLSPTGKANLIATSFLEGGVTPNT